MVESTQGALKEPTVLSKIEALASIVDSQAIYQLSFVPAGTGYVLRLYHDEALTSYVESNGFAGGVTIEQDDTGITINGTSLQTVLSGGRPGLMTGEQAAELAALLLELPTGFSWSIVEGAGFRLVMTREDGSSLESDVLEIPSVKINEVTLNLDSSAATLSLTAVNNDGTSVTSNTVTLPTGGSGGVTWNALPSSLTPEALLTGYDWKIGDQFMASISDAETETSGYLLFTVTEVSASPQYVKFVPIGGEYTDAVQTYPLLSRPGTLSSGGVSCYYLMGATSSTVSSSTTYWGVGGTLTLSGYTTATATS